MFARNFYGNFVGEKGFGGKFLEEMPYLISLNPMLSKNIQLSLSSRAIHGGAYFSDVSG